MIGCAHLFQFNPPHNQWFHYHCKWLARTYRSDKHQVSEIALNVQFSFTSWMKFPFSNKNVNQVYRTIWRFIKMQIAFMERIISGIYRLMTKRMNRSSFQDFFLNETNLFKNFNMKKIVAVWMELFRRILKWNMAEHLSKYNEKVKG